MKFSSTGAVTQQVIFIYIIGSWALSRLKKSKNLLKKHGKLCGKRSAAVERKVRLPAQSIVSRRTSSGLSSSVYPSISSYSSSALSNNREECRSTFAVMTNKAHSCAIKLDRVYIKEDKYLFSRIPEISPYLKNTVEVNESQGVTYYSRYPTLVSRRQRFAKGSGPIDIKHVTGLFIMASQQRLHSVSSQKSVSFFEANSFITEIKPTQESIVPRIDYNNFTFEDIYRHMLATNSRIKMAIINSMILETISLFQLFDITSEYKCYPANSTSDTDSTVVYEAHSIGLKNLGNSVSYNYNYLLLIIIIVLHEFSPTMSDTYIQTNQVLTHSYI